MSRQGDSKSKDKNRELGASGELRAVNSLEVGVGPGPVSLDTIWKGWDGLLSRSWRACAVSALNSILRGPQIGRSCTRGYSQVPSK